MLRWRRTEFSLAMSKPTVCRNPLFKRSCKSLLSAAGNGPGRMCQNQFFSVQADAG